ncbi:non-processive endocellulase [Neolewinella xylanilytica]|uniref:Non-processive endocellulase n=1 Tax=Neolewinella xylanilytica TaxID=1514080 RepID=A0A2S6I267_9BACT|nr:glycoside hydrolase family 9 protein [Neolewinella xylanilytica]PPK85243.1 non-processive endocellulase [Neolewinella xylanilytica]
MRFPLLFAFLTLLYTACSSDAGEGPPAYADQTTPAIQLNQVGFYPDQPIRFTCADTQAVSPGAVATSVFYVTDAKGDSTVYEGTLSDSVNWQDLAGVTARTGTVDPLPVGEYRIYVPEVGYSYPFRVQDSVLRDVFVGSMRGLYYQRAGAELPEVHAGKWARAAGHLDTTVYYHPSSGRSEGTLSSPGGWYDAGDYNKYIVNGAFPVGQYLALYEDVGDPAADGALNIPESGNGKSDYLDELKYELDWMLTMQDEDGGLYHKLTTLAFDGMVMPEAGSGRRYVVGKSITATLNFAAATAQASRVYRDYDADYADRLLAASRRAWSWAGNNPDAFFRNPADVSTGQYGDNNSDDEQAWAAAELFATTGEQEFYNDLQEHPPRVRFGAGVGWTSYMANMAAFTLLRFPDRVPREMYDHLEGLVVTLADSLVQRTESNAYFQPITEFGWGSNSDVMNAAMVMAAAHLRRPRREYIDAIGHSMNYILGHNPNAVCYLTGFGERHPMFIHHRPSASDGIDEPVPGLLSGGPNAAQQDRPETTYKPNAAPMQSWADQTPSYASNEICLNWNAPFSYVSGFMEYVAAQTGN